MGGGGGGGGGGGKEEKLLVMSNFSFSPQCFQKTCTADTSKPGLVWERFKSVHLENYPKEYNFLIIL